ncbi:MAG TPA: HAMP domain-containing sensor histidine kinase [Gemmatimonadaceae bacterium]
MRRRPRLRRTTSLVGILVLTVAMTAFLAYEAWHSAHGHRSTARRAMSDYASFAAWEYGVSAKENLASRFIFAFAPLKFVAKPGRPLPGPEILATERAADLRCPGDTAGRYFRLDLRDSSLVVSGAMHAALQQWVRDTVPKHVAKSYKTDWYYAALFRPGQREHAAIVYHTVPDPHGRPAAAYGFELCMASFAPPSFAKVFDHYGLLPPSLTQGLPNDSLLSVTVSDADGHILYRSSTQYPSDFVGEYTLEAFGGLTTHVALRPALARSLLIGGVPRSRLPVVLGVLLLTIGLVTIGLLQLRREHELARLRSDFIASVSHELRTPLAQVRMFAETLLLGRVRSEEERHRSLRIVDQEARRLTHLVENILQFSRAERSAVHLAPQPLDLAAEIDEGIECFTPVAQARQVLLEADLEPDIVAAADPGAFRQILLNLLDNAVKYGPPGQTVRVRLRRAGSAARLEVEDEGPGIPPRDRERIWEAFHRLDREVHSAVAGSGIGLSVVRELATLHGGRAWVDSGSAGGAMFVVELPAMRPAPGPGPLALGEEPAPDSALSFAGRDGLDGPAEGRVPGADARAPQARPTT